MTWNNSNIPYVPPRLTASGYDYECSLSTLSPPPGQVTNLEITSYAIRQFDISLTLSWSPPSVCNGLLAPYNICVGITPLGPAEGPQTDSNPLASTHYCGTIGGRANGTVKLAYLDRCDPGDLYVQVSLVLFGKFTMFTN